jgi:hypothetical protein
VVVPTTGPDRSVSDAAYRRLLDRLDLADDERMVAAQTRTGGRHDYSGVPRGESTRRG